MDLVWTWCGPGVYLVCTWCVPGVDLVCTWCIPSVCLVWTWCVPGVYLVCAWCVPGVYLEGDASPSGLPLPSPPPPPPPASKQLGVERDEADLDVLPEQAAPHVLKPRGHYHWGREDGGWSGVGAGAGRAGRKKESTSSNEGATLTGEHRSSCRSRRPVKPDPLSLAPTNLPSPNSQSWHLTSKLRSWFHWSF